MADISIENVPKKARENYEKGQAGLERANYDYAMDMLELALEICPEFTKARKALRTAQILKFKAGKSNAFSNAMSSLSGFGGVMSLQGLLKKDPKKAMQKAEELLRKNPLNPQFVKLAVDAALAAQMPEAAVVTLEGFTESGSADIPTLRSLAKLLQSVGRMHDARLVFEEIANQKPGDPQAIKDLKDSTALDSMQKGGWEQAKSYRDVMKDTKQATLLEQEGKAVKTGRDLDLLIEDVRQKAQREPQNINYQRSLADLYGKAGRYDEALEVLERAQKQTGGGDPQIDRLLSTIQMRKFEAEIEARRENGDTVGVEQLEQKKYSFMLQDAEDRVKRYPNDLQFKYELGVLQFDRGLMNEAIGQFQLSQRNPQRRIRSLYYLARCFKEKGQYDIAAEQLQKALSELMIMDDTKKDIVYELGCVFEAMGNTEKAVEQFKEIYAVDIGFRDIAQKIEKYYKR